ncbi:NAD(P)/FAD-dependent oxidoreductase [Streptomyces sp. NPDC059582]|uniref:NAD(P)/FAD-dependent oxidoreductase n=1 Tax=Streptomyces sp. NPDC059582 TaxID=3346875 RepID=UPI003685F704
MTGGRERGGRIVIVGAGQAGYQSAAFLRERGHAGPLTLIGDEGVLAYERPPLSKAYLTGEVGEEQLWLRPETFYTRRAIERVTGSVVALERAARRVRLGDGRVYGYDHLVMATGARARTPAVPGAGLRGVHTLRTLADAAALKTQLARAGRVVVVGAGFVGLEFAAAARQSGCQVTVLEARGRPLARTASAPVAAHVARLHEAHGSRLLFGQDIVRFHDGGGGRVAAVELAGGRRLPADLVLAGVGATPCTAPAEAAGLRVEDGIVTDSWLLTSDPHISAIGDCALFPHPRAGTRLRVESVQNAVGHARLVADRLTGTIRTYDDLPWLWSTQFSTTLQIAGLGHRHDDELVLGQDPDAFSVLLFRNGALTAVESVNRAADHMAARRLLAGNIPLGRLEAAAPGFTLHGHLTARTSHPTSRPVPAAA